MERENRSDKIFFFLSSKPVGKGILQEIKSYINGQMPRNTIRCSEMVEVVE